jgi:hypothetical protein
MQLKDMDEALSFSKSNTLKLVINERLKVLFIHGVFKFWEPLFFER